jgi:hypothetical protein
MILMVVSSRCEWFWVHHPSGISAGSSYSLSTVNLFIMVSFLLTVVVVVPYLFLLLLASFLVFADTLIVVAVAALLEVVLHGEVQASRY